MSGGPSDLRLKVTSRSVVLLAVAALLVLSLAGAWLLPRRTSRPAAAPESVDTIERPAADPATPAELSVASKIERRQAIEASSRAQAPPSSSLEDRTTQAAGGACSVYGRILDETGIALDDVEARVWLTDELGERVRADVEDDRYSADGLVAGRWWLAARAGGFYERHEEIFLTGDGTPLRLDVVLERHTVLDVRILTLEGAPLSSKPDIRLALLPVATLEPLDEWFFDVEGSVNNPFGVARFVTDKDESTGSIGRLELAPCT